MRMTDSILNAASLTVFHWSHCHEISFSKGSVTAVGFTAAVFSTVVLMSLFGHGGGHCYTICTA